VTTTAETPATIAPDDDRAVRKTLPTPATLLTNSRMRLTSHLTIGRSVDGGDT
jgi:hypothetical protein